jgi:hypothetical protein
VECDGKSLLEWIRIHSLRGWPGLAGPELGFSRTPTASVLHNDACLRLPARNNRPEIPGTLQNHPRLCKKLQIPKYIQKDPSWQKNIEISWNVLAAKKTDVQALKLWPKGIKMEEIRI